MLVQKLQLSKPRMKGKKNSLTKTENPSSSEIVNPQTCNSRISIFEHPEKLLKVGLWSCITIVVRFLVLKRTSLPHSGFCERFQPGFFFSHKINLWCSQCTGNDLLEQLAKFGYRSERKVKNLAIFWQPVASYIVNMAISETFFSSQNWRLCSR